MSCLRIRAELTPLSSSIMNDQTCAGLAKLIAESDRLQDDLPGDPTDLWTWCLTRSESQLLDVLAVIVAQTVDAVQSKHGRVGVAQVTHADAIARAIGLDMTGYFSVTAESFFNHITGASIQSVLCEANGIPPSRRWSKMKKPELATYAERQVAGSQWLPMPLRIYSEPEPNSTDA